MNTTDSARAIPITRMNCGCGLPKKLPSEEFNRLGEIRPKPAAADLCQVFGVDGGRQLTFRERVGYENMCCFSILVLSRFCGGPQKAATQQRLQRTGPCR